MATATTVKFCDRCNRKIAGSGGQLCDATHAGIGTYCDKCYEILTERERERGWDADA